MWSLDFEVESLSFHCDVDLGCVHGLKNESCDRQCEEYNAQCLYLICSLFTPHNVRETHQKLRWFQRHEIQFRLINPRPLPLVSLLLIHEWVRGAIIIWNIIYWGFLCMHIQRLCWDIKRDQNFSLANHPDRLISPNKRELYLIKAAILLRKRLHNRSHELI